MKVGMYYNNSDVRVEDIPVPPTGNDAVTLRVAACGICGSDLMEWYRVTRAPLVLGHEVCGEIIEKGPHVSQWNVGDRVFVTHHVPCGSCEYCLHGHTTACREFQKKNNFSPGGFSQYLRVSGRSLVSGTLALDDTMSWETGTFIEPVGTVMRGIRTLQLSPGERVLIVGSGITGLLFVKAARAFGAATVIAADIHEYRLQAAQRYGADYALMSDDSMISRIKEITNENLLDKVVICTGAPAAAQAALECVAPGATVLFFAVPKPGIEIPIDFNPFWRNDITIKTCYGADPLDNRQAFQMLRTKTIDVSNMITHRFGLDDIAKAFATAAQPDVSLKVIVTPD